MSTRIASVDAGSPAARAGVRPGETLLELSGHRVADVLDYKFYGYDARITLTLQTPGGAGRTVKIRKEEGEDLGLNFETYLMDRARSCANQCLFCFVDQMPPGMRKSLYFKDDDARLSFLLGNYITLTNLSPRALQRIMDLRVSPINISVHTTDPDLRVQMLKNPRAGECLAVMTRLAQAGIRMNCQVVACPGLNDGPALDRTLRDLGGLYPQVESVAVVPVGLTRFREGLYPLEPYTSAQAAALLEQVGTFAGAFLQAEGTRLAWCSDEFYLLAGRPLPPLAFYEELPQLENGVGMLRLLQHQAAFALEDLDPGAAPPPFAIATGVSAAPFLREIVDKAQARCPGLQGRVYPIRNRFFGETITVAGLVTGGDLTAQLRGQDLGTRLLLPDCMLRAGEDVFLDDVTVGQVEQALGVPVEVVEAGSGFDLAGAILGLPRERSAAALPPEDEYYRYNPER